MHEIKPVSIKPVPILESTENAGPESLLDAYTILRKPMRMTLNGTPVPSIIDTQRLTATVSDPGAEEVAVDRTELVERAFYAGARAMLRELEAAGFIGGAALPAVSGQALTKNPPGHGPVVSFSGCFLVRLAYPDRVGRI